MTSTNEIKNDILSLRGSKVRIFGQETTLRDTINDCEIDIIDILNELAAYEFDYDLLELDDISDDDAVYEKLMEYGYILDDCDYKGDNSYNWSSPISNDFDIRVYENVATGGQLIEFKVHRYGDVRCNYTDSVLYSFDNDYAFHECIFNCDKYFTVTVNDKNYDVNVTALSEGFEIYTIDGEYVCTAYGYDVDDIVQCITKNV